MTAFYSFRIGFRVVAGQAVQGGEGARGGPHRTTPRRRTRTPARPRTTDVGFPGPEHHIAEREWPMRVAMAVLGFGALFGGLIQIPGVDDVVDEVPRRAPSRARRCTRLEPSTGDAWLGLAIGGAISILGIAIAYLCYVRRPGVTVRLAERFRRLHRFLLNKWYFDELIDALDLQAGDRDRALRERGLRAVVVQRAGRPARPGSSRAPARWSAGRSRASSAPTRCSCSAASRRSASTSWWCAN